MSNLRGFAGVRFGLTAAILLAFSLSLFFACTNQPAEPETPDEIAKKSLATLVDSLNKHLLYSVCVLAVVDNSAPQSADSVIGNAGAESSSSGNDSAKRRERLVRSAIASVLVKNARLSVIDAPRSLIDDYNKIIHDKNANALSQEEAKRAGNLLAVQCVITAFVEDDGQRVSVAATSTETGKVVYQDILVGWNYEKKSEGEAE